MWPFKRKLISQEYDVKKQIGELIIKSLSLPEAAPRWTLYPQQQRQWCTKTAIAEGYNASTIVYTAVEKRAKLTASVPWYAAQKTAEGEFERLSENHPLNMLINNPNPDQSWYELIYNASQMLDLSGNAYISEIRAGARDLPAQLWVLPSQYMKIMPAKQGRLVDYYRYEYGNSPRDIDADDMIQLKLPNPEDPYFGQPVLKAASRPTDIDREAGDWQKNSLQNRGVLDIHVEVPDGTTPEQAAAIKDKLKERQTGPANARAPIVTSGKVNNLNQTAVEMDFVNSRKSVWTEIAAAFGVPLAAMGFTENVNLANAKEMDKQLWKNTIIPNLELLRRQMSHQLAKEFGDNVVMMYDLSGIEALQETFTDKLADAEKLFRMGYPANMINESLELNLPEIEGGDIGYIPTGLIPTNLDADIDEDIDAVVDDEEMDEEESEETDDEKEEKFLKLIKNLAYGK